MDASIAEFIVYLGRKQPRLFRLQFVPHTEFGFNKILGGVPEAGYRLFGIGGQTGPGFKWLVLTIEVGDAFNRSVFGFGFTPFHNQSVVLVLSDFNFAAWFHFQNDVSSATK